MTRTHTLVVGALVGGVVAVTGCTASDVGPTVAPPSVAVPAASTAPPTPESTPTPAASAMLVEFIPGTRLPAGPEPGTALGPTGAVLRFVPAEPGRTFKCRALSASERAQLADLRGPDWGQPSAKPNPVAVDVGENVVVVAYWDNFRGGRDALDNAFVTNGTRYTNIGSNWPGSHTHAGVALADGPAAIRAARECISTPA